MTISSRYWKHKQEKYLKRKKGNRGKPKDSFLIVCEGEKTEPNYFNSFRVPGEIKEVFGLGSNTVGLVEEALEIQKEAKKFGFKFDQVWCVFDKDDFPTANFDAAIQLAKRRNINVAYSNEAFELWYVLHFCYYNTPVSRHALENRLKGTLGSYEKNSIEMYEILLDKQAQAIHNARSLLNSYSPVNPAQDNPSTTVHLLVQELNMFVK